MEEFEVSTKILIVDDAIFMRIMLRDMLEKNGFEVIGEAADGFEAIDKYKALNPDIVTMDVTMPQLNGIDALKEIIKYDASAKIIMCSAMGQQLMVMDSIKAGAKDFIVKPFERDRVIGALQKLIG